jgi:hypothetical protein
VLPPGETGQTGYARSALLSNVRWAAVGAPREWATRRIAADSHPRGAGGWPRPQPALTNARSDWRIEPIDWSTAVGSYPQWAMQFSQRGSLPRPYRSQSVVSSSSL